MSIAEKMTQMHDRIDALISESNEATGNGDTTLTDAVNTLIEGFGKIPGIKIRTGSVVFTEKTQICEITHDFGTVPKCLIVYTDTAYKDMPASCVLISSITYYGTSEQTDSNGDELTGENAIYKTNAQCSAGMSYIKMKSGPSLKVSPDEVFEPDVECSLPNGAMYYKYTNPQTAFFPVTANRTYAPVEYKWVIIG